ncbi:malto-oligosyltrehalose synthase [Auraticoccus sp. F435]|uniref:Malto-oligosyltrehalose synthase n=1 Tax=Auraticoccus cholistanensis TaxID=2656650 RepID=A0A6A9UYE1_9ACTN|nr:malto-oligosyltrehalose synthase [Auraticoccus cholistanensis]
MSSPAATTVPTSTYRLQIRPQLSLDDAAALVDYLVELGVGAVYLSPLLTSTRGSDHGYDVTDPTTIDVPRGGEEGWRHLVEAAQQAGLGVVLDIVPNHLGVAAPAENPAWWSVLAEGQDSPYAHWFDIDWSTAPLRIPVLGDEVGADELELVEVPGGHEIRYHEHRYPVAAGTVTEGAGVEQVLERQHYRLVNWRRAATELNYRRFFAVADLAGLRVEDERVFTATHERVARMVAEGQLTGIRVDHPDGLVDPRQYFERLRELAPTAWLVAEKILEPGEELPDWPVQGTSGYDAMTEVNQVFVDRAAEEEMTRLYTDLTGDTRTMHDAVREGKRHVVATLFGSELARIAALVPELDTDRVRTALGELAVHFRVYRSYLPDGAADLDAAIEGASADPEVAATLAELSPRLHDAGDELARRVQQLSGAVMAKGTEDTAYYRQARFVALNEVGGDPDSFGIPVQEFHRAQQRRQQRLPQSMTALSTHDTKRGEDVRARLAVLAEVPGTWARFARRFLDHAGVPGDDVAGRAFGYLLAQTLVGVGRADRERLHAYAEKAMREASASTSWDAPDEAFEAAVHAAVDRAHDDPSLADDLARVLTVVEQPGWSNALGQKLVQLTMPGVPDVYQGTELWEDSLVDPDNRRPVDFALRRRLLAEDPSPVVDASGTAKLRVVREALRLRRDRPELFTGYTPVLADGPAADHLLAFDRGGAVTCVTRLPLTLAEAGGWRDTAIEVGAVVDVLSGRQHSGRVPAADLFASLPVALLAPR